MRKGTEEIGKQSHVVFHEAALAVQCAPAFPGLQTGSRAAVGSLRHTMDSCTWVPAAVMSNNRLPQILLSTQCSDKEKR